MPQNLPHFQVTTPEKDHLRKLARRTLQKLSPEDLKSRSANLLTRIPDFLAQHYPEARRIATFAALPHEPDLSLLHILCPKLDFYYPLVLDKHRLAFHLVSDPSTLVQGAFKIPEPNPQKHVPTLNEDLDLILLPGLAFDLAGNRLGQGAGYYDRFLDQIPLTPRIGISFASQLLPTLPTEPHDLAVQAIITDRDSHEIRRK